AHCRYRLLVLAGADRFSADRGPGLHDRALVQLPDGASLERTQKVLDKVFEIARKTPGVARVVNIAGVSALDNSATLSSAGVSYISLKDWNERGEGEDLMSLFNKLNADLAVIRGGCPRDAAATDPGHRQRRRFHDAGRAARRQLRHGQAAERHQRHRR